MTARSAEKFRTPHSEFRTGLRLRLGLPKSCDAVAVFPLAAFLEEFGTLEALEDIALATESGRRAQTAML
jgi:hypothetical protein